MCVLKEATFTWFTAFPTQMTMLKYLFSLEESKVQLLQQ